MCPKVFFFFFFGGKEKKTIQEDGRGGNGGGCMCVRRYCTTRAGQLASYNLKIKNYHYVCVSNIYLDSIIRS